MRSFLSSWASHDVSLPQLRVRQKVSSTIFKCTIHRVLYTKSHFNRQQFYRIFFFLEIALNYENIFIGKTIVGVEARQARDCASSNYLWWIWMVIPSFLSRINATEWHQTGQKEKKKWISCTIGYERKAMKNSDCNHLERSWKMNDAIKTQLTSWQSQRCCLVCNISRVCETNQW